MSSPNRLKDHDDVAEEGHADESLLIHLNEILATGVIFILRYRRHETMAKGILSHSTAFEFQKLAQDEQDHVDLVAARISALGGEPNFAPIGRLMASHSEYIDRGSLSEMIKDDWVAARIAIDSCADMIGLIKGKDVVTVRILESLLTTKKSHARTLLRLIDLFEPKKIPAPAVPPDLTLYGRGRS